MDKEKFIPKKEDDFTIEAISDFQGAPVDEVLSKIDEKDIDFYVQTGDLAFSPVLEKLDKEFKDIPKEKMAEIEKDPVYQKYLEKTKRPRVAYVRYMLEKDPELARKNLEGTKIAHEELIGKLKEKLGDKIIHIWGNYDQNKPDHAQIVSDVLKDYEMTSFRSPHFSEISKETAIIYWPYQEIKTEEDKEKLTKLAEEYRGRIKGKNQVIVFGHEHLFRGPSEETYKKELAKSGIKPKRTPASQPNPTAKYIMRIFKGLNPDAKGVYVFGHLHSPEEEIEKGIKYFHGKEGKIPMRIFGLGEKIPEEYKGKGTRKTIDLVYVPQGMVAKLRFRKGKELEVEKK